MGYVRESHMSHIVVISPDELRSLVSEAVEDGVRQAIRNVASSVPEHMSEDEAALYLNIAANTLRNWRAQKTGPTYHKAGRSVRYDRADLDAWKARQRILTVDSPEVQGRLYEMSH